MKLKIKVKLFNKEQSLPVIIKKGDWVDLSISKDTYIFPPQAGTLKKKQEQFYRNVTAKVEYLPLGVAMKLPDGFEALVVPRSSTPNKYGIICANSIGVIDGSFCGNDDEWKFPAIAIRETYIEKGTRICQFRIQLSQKATMWQKIKWLFSSGIELVGVDCLCDENRGGIGTTGSNKLN